MEPKVTIILVNYNGDMDTLACVDSLSKVNYNNYEVIVVDNASKNQDKLENEMPDNVIYIKSHNNLGFSGGNNIGIHYAMELGTDYVILLNNDTVVDKNFIYELVKLANEKENVGIITGKILYYSKPDFIWYAGGYMNLDKAKIKHLHIHEKDDFADEVKNVNFATGCLMMIPRKVLETVGVLNDIFFMYAEDAEYCVRIYKAGYKIWYTPDAKIFHKVSASSGGAGSKLSQYYRTRNEMYLVLHHAKHKVLGSIYYGVRYIKRVAVGQFTLKCTCAGILDLYKKKMRKTDRRF